MTDDGGYIFPSQEAKDEFMATFIGNIYKMPALWKGNPIESLSRDELIKVVHECIAMVEQTVEQARKKREDMLDYFLGPHRDPKVEAQLPI